MSNKELFICTAEAIKHRRFVEAKKFLSEALSNDMENPEVYNLLGIAYEREGDNTKASKFYRVAYYMDQTFKPASINLDRVCGLWHQGNNISWGINLKEEEL